MAHAHAPRSTCQRPSHAPPAGSVPFQALCCLLLTHRPSSDTQEPTRLHTSSSFLSRRWTQAGGCHMLLKVPGGVGHHCLQQWPHVASSQRPFPASFTRASWHQPPNKLPAPKCSSRTSPPQNPNQGTPLDKIFHCGRFLPQIPILQTFQVSILLPKAVLSKFLLLDKLKGASASS